MILTFLLRNSIVANQLKKEKIEINLQLINLIFNKHQENGISKKLNFMSNF